MLYQEKYYAMCYEDLADYVVLRVPNAPFEGIMELIPWHLHKLITF